MKYLKALGLGCSAVMLGALLYGYWALFTPWGARYTIRQIAHDTLGMDKISWNRIEGTLAGGIRVNGL